jgi:hypothetical protein
MDGAGGRQSRRARRPLSREEIARLIEIKRFKEQQKRLRFRKTAHYKWLNLFVLGCVFIVAEMLMAYLGPVRYEADDVVQATANYGSHWWDQSPIVSSIEISTREHGLIELVTQGMVRQPHPGETVWIGYDYLLNKPIKGSIDGGENTYRLFRASPMLLLAFLCLLVTFTGYFNHLNELPYSLNGLAVLNLLTLLGIICL